MSFHGLRFMLTFPSPILGRGGSDADMAAAILYLVSPGGVFLNNQLLHPEGGQLLVAPAAI